MVYISTSGVYGDCGGSWVDETRRYNAQTLRAKRRLDAEGALRRFGVSRGVVVTILRAPGIYASDRLPLERIKAREPVLRAEDDVYTNHVHADDLAILVCKALRRGRPGRAYNASDDTQLRMGDYFDLLADAFGMDRPPRVSREEVATRLSPSRLSFAGESRRLVNGRMKRELGMNLKYPSVVSGIREALGQIGSEPGSHGLGKIAACRR